MGLWSSDAETAFQQTSVRCKWLVYIDLIDSGGAYGNYIQDVTDRIVSISKISRQSSCVEKRWKISPVTIVLDNYDGYMTPNLPDYWHEIDDNVWMQGDLNEADYFECKVIIKQRVWLASGKVETQTRYIGRIKDLNFIVEKGNNHIELICEEDYLDIMSTTYDYDEGRSTTAAVP